LRQCQVRALVEKENSDIRCAICGRLYLVEVAIASIVNELERHVGTVRNAADSSVGQVERNAKPAAPSGAGKVSDQLLPSG
jgi:hypothetical protein